MIIHVGNVFFQEVDGMELLVVTICVADASLTFRIVQNSNKIPIALILHN